MTSVAEREKWTYEKKYLARNIPRRTCGLGGMKPGCGKVHKYLTRDCKPVLHPDQWKGTKDEMPSFPFVSAPATMRTKNLPRMGE